MLKKFKITTCAFILCLFGLTLMTVSPIFADDSIDFVECQQIKPNRTSYALMKEKKNCFRDIARESLLTIALVLAEIEKHPETLEIMRTLYANGQLHQDITTTDIGQAAEKFGNTGITTEGEAVSTTKLVLMSLSLITSIFDR